MFSQETAENFCAQILYCGVGDIKFAIDFYNRHKLDFNYDVLKSNYWEVTIDTIIYDWLYQSSEKFIDEYEIQIKQILNVFDLNEYRNYNDLYEIYANSVASSISFIDERIQALFEQSRYEV